MKRFFQSCVWLTSLVCVLTNATSVLADVVDYKWGHADIGIALEDGTDFFLHYHFSAGARLGDVTLNVGEDAEFEPEDIRVIVPDAAIVSYNFATPFLGIGANVPYFELPQFPAANIPSPGFAREELPSTYNNVVFALTSFSGPGHMAIYDANDNAFFSTVDGVNPAFDRFPLTNEGHSHVFWGFTDPGIYVFTLEASAFNTLTSLTETDSGTFTFVVGDIAAIPEPGTFGLLAVAAGASGWFARRRVKGQSDKTPVTV